MSRMNLLFHREQKSCLYNNDRVSRTWPKKFTRRFGVFFHIDFDLIGLKCFVY